MMGAIAGRLADLAVLTNDNPRTEDPMAILDEVYAGVEEPRRSGVRIEPDRRAAIAFAFSVAQPGDVVLIAGKGHETGQDIGGVVAPFDDRQVARTLLGPVARSDRRDAEGSPACA